MLSLGDLGDIQVTVQTMTLQTDFTRQFAKYRDRIHHFTVIIAK